MANSQGATQIKAVATDQDTPAAGGTASNTQQGAGTASPARRMPVVATFVVVAVAVLTAMFLQIARTDGFGTTSGTQSSTDSAVDVSRETPSAVQFARQEQAGSAAALTIRDVDVYQASTSRPLTIRDVDNYQASTSRPLTIRDVDNYPTSTPRPLTIRDVDNYPTSTPRPLTIRDVDVYQASTPRALTIKDVDHWAPVAR